MSHFPIKLNEHKYPSKLYLKGITNSLFISNKKYQEIENFLLNYHINEYGLIYYSSDSASLNEEDIIFNMLPVRKTTLSLDPIKEFTKVKFTIDKRYEVSNNKFYYNTCDIIDKKVLSLNNYSTNNTPTDVYYISFVDKQGSSGYVYLRDDLSILCGKYSIWDLDASPINNDKFDTYSKFELIK